MEHRIRPAMAVFCDFDGTITRADATDAVLENFALPAWRDWELKWRRGEISSQACLSRQVELIRASQEDLLEFAAALPIDEGIFMLDQMCAEQRVPLTILSDGLDLIAGAVLEHHGLQHIPVFANHVLCDPAGGFSLSFPHARKDCLKASGTCKCALTEARRKSGMCAVYVGDGRSDFCVSTQVKTLFAKGELRTWCEMEEIPHHAFETLREVAQALFRKEAAVR